MSRLLSTALIALALVTGAPRPTLAVETVAVFPFELLDSSQEGELIIKVRPEESKRLAAMADDLVARLVASKQFEVISTAPVAAELKAQYPLHQCNGCEGDIAKKSGAQLVMLGLVQKFSDTLLAVNLQIMDASTGALKASYSAGVQGNTDEAWLRGLSYIVKNKVIKDEGRPQ